MNFSSRRLEERIVDPVSGSPITEWEPARMPDWMRPLPDTDDEWRAAIRTLNAKAKSEGSFLRYRSVVDE